MTRNLKHLARHLLHLRLGIGALLGVLLFFSLIQRYSPPEQPSRALSLAPTIQQLDPLQATPSPDQPRTYVGVYLTDVSGFDLKEGRFNADLEVWCKWAGGEAVPFIRLANGEIQEREEVMREDEGNWHSIRWRIQGTFRGTFPLHRYPFDRQDLRIQVDLPDTQGPLLPDLAGSGMTDQFSITGWLYRPFFRAEQFPQRYFSDFGAIATEGKPLQVNSVVFILELRRPMMAYVVKSLLPLSVIIGTALASLFLPAVEVEARIGMVVTALLSCVALNLSQAEALPEVPYPVTADKVYILSYLLIFIVLIITLLAHHWFNRGDEWADRSQKLDRISFAVVAVMILITSCFLIAGALPWPDKPQLQPVAQLFPPQVSARDELRYGVLNLPNLNIHGISRGLLRRLLYYPISEGKRQSLLIDQIPDMTNENVRFLPDGGMVVRWRLKRGLYWGDGFRITATDLMFFFQIAQETAADHPEYQDLVEFVQVDPLTVEVRYRNRERSHLEPFYLLPKHSLARVYADQGYEGVLERLHTNPPPLNGPYILEEFVADDHALLKRNPFFAGSPPAISRIHFQRIESLPQSFRQGEVDLATNLSSKTASEMPADAILENHPNELFYQLIPDVTAAPLDNVLVRKAMLTAINREQLIPILYGEGGGYVSHSYVARFLGDYAPDVVPYSYDPDQARFLLQQSGVTLPIALRIYQREYRPEYPEAVAVKRIKQNLEAVGFQITINPLDPAEGASEQLKQNLHGGLYFTKTTDSENVRKFWNIALDENQRYLINPHRLLDQEVLTLFQNMDTTLFEERRRLLAQRLQVKWTERLPVLPLVMGGEITVRVPTLQRWQPTAAGFKAGQEWWNVEYLYFTPTAIRSAQPRTHLP
ncbi:MAG: hypothetical protein HC921_09795 [Synechococcaceae cyanobacterium SM2_3_1]|nr:hypothetical protein [Synechococcaceae cyanobacterium SM2_3_1]